jgi:hypothetical protein
MLRDSCFEELSENGQSCFGHLSSGCCGTSCNFVVDGGFIEGQVSSNQARSTNHTFERIFPNLHEEDYQILDRSQHPRPGNVP